MSINFNFIKDRDIFKKEFIFAAALAAGSLVMINPFIAILALSVLLIFVSALIFPQIVMSLLLISRASIERIYNVQIEGVPVTNIATISTSGVIILLLVVMWLKRPHFPRILRSFACFLLISFLGIFLSLNRAGFIIDFFRIFSYFAVLWLMMILTVNKNVKLFIASFFCSLLIPIGFATYQLIFQKGYSLFGGFNRIFATLRHPSDYGYFLLIFIIILLGFWFMNFKRANTFIFSILLAFLIIHMVYTFSRMVWIIFIFAVYLFSVIAKLKKPLKVLFLFFMIALVAMVFMNKIVSRFEMEFLSSNYSAFGIRELFGIPITGSSASRLSFIQEAFKEFIAHPLFGRGLGFFYYYLSPKNFGSNIEVHSDLIKLLCETGIVGTALFFYFFYKLLSHFRSSYRKTRDDLTKTFCLIGIVLLGTKMMQMCLDASLRLADVEFYWWALIGFILGIIEIDNRKSCDHFQAIVKTNPGSL